MIRVRTTPQDNGVEKLPFHKRILNVRSSWSPAVARRLLAKAEAFMSLLYIWKLRRGRQLAVVVHLEAET